MGAVSFLALEAIGGALVVNYGFTNAVCAILAVAVLIFLTGMPISYYAARFGVDPRIYLTTGEKFVGDKNGNVKELHIYAVEWTRNEGPAPSKWMRPWSFVQWHVRPGKS